MEGTVPACDTRNVLYMTCHGVTTVLALVPTCSFYLPPCGVCWYSQTTWIFARWLQPLAGKKRSILKGKSPAGDAVDVRCTRVGVLRPYSGSNNGTRVVAENAAIMFGISGFLVLYCIAEMGSQMRATHRPSRLDLGSGSAAHDFKSVPARSRDWNEWATRRKLVS